jgi:hypothetical protein
MNRHRQAAARFLGILAAAILAITIPLPAGAQYYGCGSYSGYSTSYG